MDITGPAKPRRRPTGGASGPGVIAKFSPADWRLVSTYIRKQWSPEQVSGWLGKEGQLRISHETIYRYIWADKAGGGILWTHLRGARKNCRKRYGGYDSRGRLAGKRHISERPPVVETRTTVGHWEADTVMGAADKHCILTLVERKTGYVVIGKLTNRTKRQLRKRAIPLINNQPTKVKTITCDHGTEFHCYKAIERRTDSLFYFANPYHSWERGTNENTNGLIRQYLPKGKSMEPLTQWDCKRIANTLNSRPRKRLGYQTPEECYVQNE